MVRWVLWHSHNLAKQQVKKRKQTTLKKWGVENVAQLPTIRKKMEKTAILNGNTIYTFARKDIQERNKQTYRERYGVTNPSQIPGATAKILKNRVATWLSKYGVDNPMKVSEIARKWAIQNKVTPTSYEQKVMDMNVGLRYVGDMQMAVDADNRVRYPDFVSETDFAKVVEVIGNPYFHGPKFTGKSYKEHAEDIQNHYAKAKIDCCIIMWHEFGDLNKIKEKILHFLRS